MTERFSENRYTTVIENPEIAPSPSPPSTVELRLGRYVRSLETDVPPLPPSEAAFKNILRSDTSGTFVVCGHCRWIDTCEANKHCART